MIRPVEYTVYLDEPQTQTLRVHMLVRSIAAPTLQIALPVWRQGRYQVLDPAGTVHEVRAQTSTGQALPIVKIDKTTWQVDTAGISEVVVTYRVYANSLGDRTRHVDDTHAYLSGATIFLYVPERRHEPLSVRLEGAPADWRVACGLKHEAGDPRLLLAPNYDVLIDSPIEVGIHEALCFKVDDKPHDVAIWGEARFDSDKLERDLARIVRTAAAIFGDLPYHRYVFIVHLAPGLRGGTEHLNSTILQAPPRALEDSEQYKLFLALAAHEVFHVWNVKRLRPSALSHIDLTRENYTDLLWFCEGATAYYDELLVVRAGLDSPEAYLKALAETIYQQRARPGAALQSVAESSFDAWIKFNQPTADDVNSTVSFYDSGSLASLLLDLELRQRSQNQASLDTLMREMYHAFPDSGPGFTTADLIAAASRIGGWQADEFFQRFIFGSERYPFEEALLTVGLEMTVKDPAPRAYIGLSLQDTNGACTVRSVLSDGPAYRAGINAGDEIVSLNGRRFAAADVTPWVELHMAPGDAVWVQLLRRNRQRRIDFALGTKPNPRWELKRVAEPTPTQQTAYASWLGPAF